MSRTNKNPKAVNRRVVDILHLSSVGQLLAAGAIQFQGFFHCLKDGEALEVRDLSGNAERILNEYRVRQAAAVERYRARVAA